MTFERIFFYFWLRFLSYASEPFSVDFPSKAYESLFTIEIQFRKIANQIHKSLPLIRSETKKKLVLICMATYIAATVGITEWRTKFRQGMNRRDNETNGRAIDSLLNYEQVKTNVKEKYEVDSYEELGHL